jgi:hypothetical protein
VLICIQVQCLLTLHCLEGMLPDNGLPICDLHLYPSLYLLLILFTISIKCITNKEKYFHHIIPYQNVLVNRVYQVK